MLTPKPFAALQGVMTDYKAIAVGAGVKVCINYTHNMFGGAESVPNGFLWILRSVGAFKMCKKVYDTESEAWEAACVDNGLLK